MATTVYPLHYSCLLCNSNATFYSGFYSEEVQAFRDYHYNDELCVA